jgi:hypothetical protein
MRAYTCFSRRFCSLSAVGGDDDKGSGLENRVVFFGGKMRDDVALESVGGLKPTYNFKAPFDRYQPMVVRNKLSELFR